MVEGRLGMESEGGGKESERGAISDEIVSGDIDVGEGSWRG
jgi:hypothetical protein